MSLYCLLWMPVFYLFWRSVTENKSSAGGVWALIIGSIVALIQFFLGALLDPLGFGFSRWMSGFVDLVSLPALAPILVYFILVCLKFVQGAFEFTNFALLWLIPGAAIRAVSWSAQSDPILLVLVPFLWTAVAVGVSFFLTIILKSRVFVIVVSSLAILVIPFAAASSYWAFYSQKSMEGSLFLTIAAAPMIVSMVLSFIRAEN